jgi:hypothetical protein
MWVSRKRWRNLEERLEKMEYEWEYKLRYLNAEISKLQEARDREHYRRVEEYMGTAGCFCPKLAMGVYEEKFGAWPHSPSQGVVMMQNQYPELFKKGTKSK